MPKHIYITFGGATYDSKTVNIVNDGPKLGADEVWVYDDRWLTGQSLYRDHHWLWEHRGVGNPNGGRGFGWFSWKPFIMADALSRSQDGDIILFTDADTFPIADFSVLYKECNRIGGTMLFAAQGCNHRHWCKRDCFIRMKMDEPRYHDVPAGVARFYLFQKGGEGVAAFMDNWQHFCVDRLSTTFEPSVLAPELSEFREHRCEQAILTNMAYKYGHKLYREMCEFGNGSDQDRDLYPQLFKQEWCNGDKNPVGSQFFKVPGESR